jgi:nucleoside-diphosphate-sugar epimerase
MTNTVLVLGARGRLGGAVAQAFAAAGWRVLAQRRVGRHPRRGGWGHRMGVGRCRRHRNAAARRRRRARGGACDEPGLHRGGLARRGARADAGSDRLAAALGAHLLFPGNVYNFGAGMPAVLAPDTPQRPTTGKGRIRVDLEQQLAQAARHHGFAATVIRAGDFFGAGSGSWLDQVIVKKLPRAA